MNKHLAKLDDLNFPLEDGESGPKSRTSIRGIQTLDKGALCFDLDSPGSADRFKTYSTDPNTDLLKFHLSATATLKPKGHNLIFKFVPCTDDFDPGSPDGLSELESDNNLPPGSILSASCIKRIENRSNNQTVASLKVVCTSATAANHLLRERVYVRGLVVPVRKDIREAI
jgi:hypothetical protein